MAKHTSKCLHWSATPVPAASCAQLPIGGFSLLSMNKITPQIFGEQIWNSSLKIHHPSHNFGLRLQVRKPPLPNPSFPYEPIETKNVTKRPQGGGAFSSASLRNKGKKQKHFSFLFGTQSKARAGWPTRLRLLQTTPWADFAVITAQLWTTITAIFSWVNNFAFNFYLRPRF